MISNILKKYSVTLLDEKWNVIQPKVRFKFIPRIYELIYLANKNEYYRVVNVVYSVDKHVETFVVIEKHTDDFKLIEKK